MGRQLKVMEDEGRCVLTVDGVILSVAVEGDEQVSGYWPAMLPEGPPRTALLLGLGGGTLAHLLARRYAGIQIVGVDVDAELIEFARREFGLDLPNLEVVIADAFDYVARCDRSFDYVAVDLFEDYKLLRGVTSKPFLRGLKSIVGHGGEVVFDVFKDRRTAQHVERIGRVLRVSRVHQVGKNVLVRCRG